MKKLLLSSILLGLTLGTFAAPSALAGRSESRTSGSMTVRQSSSSESSSGGVYIRPNSTLRPDRGNISNQRREDYFTLINKTSIDIPFTLDSHRRGGVEEIIYAGETYDFPARRTVKLTFDRSDFSHSSVKETLTVQPGETFRIERPFSWKLRFYKVSK